MIADIHPRFHRVPGFLALTCAVSMGLSSCSMFHKNNSNASQQPPVYPSAQNEKPHHGAQASAAAAQQRPAKLPKVAPAAAGAPEAAPAPAAPSGPVPANPDNSGLPAAGAAHAPKSITSVPVSGKFIALTFDDGPSSANTPRLLAMLRQRNIKATFFMVGENVDAHPGIVKQIVAEGHEVGNHSYSHPLLTKQGDDAFHSQVSRTHDAIVRACGVTPTVMRPPYGALTPSQKEWIASQYGYHCVLWSVDPLDWKNRNSATVRSRILAQTKPGGIILAHDIHATTVDAMPGTLDELLRRGYQFVTVSQLIAMGGQG